MIAVVSFILLLFLPETYGPVILKRRAQKMRKATGHPNIYAPIELEKKGAKQMMTVTLARPIRMLLFEAIVLFTCLYLALAYAIFCKDPFSLIETSCVALSNRVLLQTFFSRHTLSFSKAS